MATGGVTGNEEVIAKIKDLRKTYNLDRYKAESGRLIALITDPSHDSDYDKEDVSSKTK